MAFGSLGFSDVMTFLGSGNVIFPGRRVAAGWRGQGDVTEPSPLHTFRHDKQIAEVKATPEYPSN